MAEGLSNYGEEQLLKNGIDGKTVDLILYDDSVDDLSDTDGTGAITSQPTGGTTTKTITLQSSDFELNNGDWRFTRAETFADVTDASGRVDAAAVAEGTDIIFRGLFRDSNGDPQPISDIGPVDKLDPLNINISLD